MQAALPYIDVFASGHNLASIEAAALQLTGTAPSGRPVGR
jgi:uncharacterized protein with von Willebrand factor type A (vWA) domain